MICELRSGTLWNHTYAHFTFLSAISIGVPPTIHHIATTSQTEHRIEVVKPPKLLKSKDTHRKLIFKQTISAHEKDDNEESTINIR
jgi:predicted transposase YbfD/YdcC